MTERREVVVVGAGLTGLSAAAELARRGRDVLCLERAGVGHEWSGSKGDSRIFRLGYDDPLYVDLARRSLPGWRALEEGAGEPLLLDCGLLSFGAGLDELAAGMAAAGGDPQWLDAAAVASRFPGLSPAGSGSAVLDPTAGVLLADRVLAALAGAGGFELREQAAVTALEDTGPRVVVRTAGAGARAGGAAAVDAEVVLVCAGPWTSGLLAGCGIACDTRTTLEQVVYFGVPPAAGGRLLPAMAWRGDPPADDGAGATAELGRFGASTARMTDPVAPTPAHAPAPERLALYGLPAPAARCYKLGLHYAGPEVVPGVVALEEAPAFTAQLVEAAGELLVGVEPVPVRVERCVYDNTSDGDFVLDRVGRIVVGAGTSGHGFKFGPVLGRLLAGLTLGEEPEVDLGRFSLRRRAVAGP